jgi:hypothetical protein
MGESSHRKKKSAILMLDHFYTINNPKNIHSLITPPL